MRAFPIAGVVSAPAARQHLSPFNRMPAARATALAAGVGASGRASAPRLAAASRGAVAYSPGNAFLGGKGLGIALPPIRARGAARRATTARYTPSERAVAAIPYVLPLLDGIRYGRFFFMQFPASAVALSPLMPVITIYNQVPFAGLIFFFSLYYGIANNQSFVRYVRVNCMQAVLLDILLILPGLVENVWTPPASGFGLQMYVSFYNTIWLYVLISVTYAVGSCIAGQMARVPGVADAAEAQVR